MSDKSAIADDTPFCNPMQVYLGSVLGGRAAFAILGAEGIVDARKVGAAASVAGTTSHLGTPTKLCVEACTDSCTVIPMMSDLDVAYVGSATSADVNQNYLKCNRAARINL